MDQPDIPGITPPPPTPQFTLLTELEIQNHRKALIEANGDMEAAGISLETMRNIIYTCRMKANPMQENEAIAKPAKKVKAPSTTTGKLSGDEVNNLFG